MGLCRNLAGFLHEIPVRFLQNPAGSCKILEDLAGVQKKDLFLQDLARAFLLGSLGGIKTHDIIFKFFIIR